MPPAAIANASAYSHHTSGSRAILPGRSTACANAAALSAPQAAFLAAILPSPRRYGRGQTTAYVSLPSHGYGAAGSTLGCTYVIPTPYSGVFTMGCGTTTIVDANLTTLLKMAILYQFGSGPVRGFAVTLAIGIVCSMFTSVTATKLMCFAWVSWLKPKVLPV